MRKSTLNFYIFIKYVEMLFLFLFTTLIISSGAWIISKLANDSDTFEKEGTLFSTKRMLLTFTSLSLIIAIWNLFFNTLFTNLRLLAKMRCVTLGLCVFDCMNYICCYKCCKFGCQDRCSSGGCPKLQTAFKWLLSAIIVGTNIYYIRE